MPGTSSSQRRDSMVLRRSEHELAGGVEDWEDIDGASVDRYGFIQPKGLRTPATDTRSTARSPSRRRNVLTKPDPADPNSSSARTPSRKISARSLNTHTSEVSASSRHSSRLRQASNLLPHNRGRRLMDDAADMLTMSPGLADIAEDDEASKIAESLKRKEWERSEKWRKMAKVIKKGEKGKNGGETEGNMEFEFDTKNPKVVDRTWKGIPDRWRAAAWYSFLATSARSRKGSPTEEELISEFHRLQDVDSEDDVQIDLDVPRTINRHIMFRRRYRGGQRLLFRALHAIALYFPEVGYVQGMAPLAATLLCYFDEEKCFVMLARMWRLRGLERLFRPGFEGLMESLRDFESRWIGGQDVGKKLVGSLFFSLLFSLLPSNKKLTIFRSTS